MQIVASNADRKTFHPFCEICGWRKGGVDSWDGKSCKCKHAEPPQKAVDPTTCWHCEYDRRFPGFETGGWLQQDNNGPIVSCPVCNTKGEHPRQ